MKNNAIIIFGSSRSNGNTKHAIEQVEENLKYKFPLIDLNQCNVQEFSYAFDQNDDFSTIINEVLKYNLIILATPVYWYSPSATMKKFIDRMSDLLSINKELGRRLRGKKLAVISSYGTYPGGITGFENTMQNIADYLGMAYVDTYHYYAGEDQETQEAYKKSQNDMVIFAKKLNKIINEFKLNTTEAVCL